MPADFVEKRAHELTSILTEVNGQVILLRPIVVYNCSRYRDGRQERPLRIEQAQAEQLVLFLLFVRPITFCSSS